MKQLNVCVVGAGVNGLCSAICIKNKYPDSNLTIIAEKFSPDTTGDGAAGFWYPYLLANTPESLVTKWSKATYKLYHQLWKSGLADEAGVSVIPSIKLFLPNEPYYIPNYLEFVFNFHEYSSEELRKISEEHGCLYSNGFFFTTFTCEPVKLLPFLMKQLQSKQCKIIQRRIRSLTELYTDYDVIVNCTGLSSQTIVPDCEVFPVRGQVARVKAPWQYHIISVGHGYIIPNIDSVVLGGTSQEYDYSLKVDPTDSTNIFNECYNFIPGLKSCPVMQEWVGLRPARDTVRLEMDESTTRMEGTPEKVDKSKYSIVIHNYGHGGAGITLCWGCAVDVAELIQNIAIKHLSSSALSPSKL